jgi:hypothetical protein
VGEQEIVKFNRLLTAMSASLTDLQKAIKGLIVMTLDLDKMYTSFLTNKVPGLWYVPIASCIPCLLCVREETGAGVKGGERLMLQGMLRCAPATTEGGTAQATLRLCGGEADFCVMDERGAGAGMQGPYF